MFCWRVGFDLGFWVKRVLGLIWVGWLCAASFGLRLVGFPVVSCFYGLREFGVECLSGFECLLVFG